MTLVSMLVRAAGFVALATVTLVAALLLTNVGLRFYVADGPDFAQQAAEYVNRELRTGRIPEIRAWLTTADIFTPTYRAWLVSLLDFKMVIVETPQLDLLEGVTNLFGLFTLGFLLPLLPLFGIFVFIAALFMAGGENALLTIVGIVLLAAFIALFSVLLCLWALLLWGQYFFHTATPAYLLLWFFGGLHTFGLGLSLSAWALTAPFLGNTFAPMNGPLGDLLRPIVLFPVTLFQALKCTIAWLHYFFVPHPAEATIKAGRGSNGMGKVDLRAVAADMERDIAADFDPSTHPSAYKTENQRKRAEALRKLEEEDIKLMEKSAERELAWRKLEKAKRGEQ